MYKLTVKNFQSIKHQEFEFEGFNVITGASHLGKSAVIRACDSVLFNAWNNVYLRNKVGQAEITFETDNHTIKKIRSDKKNSYVIEQQDQMPVTLDKVGRGQPEEVRDLGYRNLTLEKEDPINLMVTKQLDPMFMVSYRDTLNTKILNNLFNVSKLENAAKFVQSDIRAAKAESNRVLADYNTKQVELEELKGQYETVSAQYEKAIELVDAIELVESYIAQVELDSDLSNQALGITASIETQENVLEALKCLETLNQYLDLVEQATVLSGNQVQLNAQIDSAETSLNALTALKTLESYNGICETFKTAHRDLQDVSERITNLSKQKDLLDNLKVLTSYQEFVKSQSDVVHQQKTLQAELDKYACIDPKAIQLLIQFENFTQELETLYTKADKAQELETSLLSQKQTLQAQVKHDEKRCPHCGGVLED